MKDSFQETFGTITTQNLKTVIEHPGKLTTHSVTETTAYLLTYIFTEKYF